MGDDVANALPDAFGRRLVLAGPDAGELFPQPAGGREKEMAGAAGRVADLKPQ